MGEEARGLEEARGRKRTQEDERGLKRAQEDWKRAQEEARG